MKIWVILPPGIRRYRLFHYLNTEENKIGHFESGSLLEKSIFVLLFQVVKKSNFRILPWLTLISKQIKLRLSSLFLHFGNFSPKES